jgi:hypothetical protein
MAAAINKLHNETYPVATVKGVVVPNIALFSSMSCTGFLGCWQSTTSAMYIPIQYEGSNEIAVYSRPIFIQTTGTQIILTLYSIPIDTTWVQFDDEKIKKELFSENDKWDDDISMSMTRHDESGSVYYKLVGIVDPVKRPIEPSALGEAMGYFFYMTGKGLMDRITELEFDALKRLRKTKQSFYKRGEMRALLNMYDYDVKDSKIPEGEWTFSKSEGKKWCYIYNDGTKLTFFLNIKADEKIADKVGAKMEEWVKKHQFKNGTSTVVEKSGGYYWVKTFCMLGDREGNDIVEDYYEAFFNDYGDDVVDEVEDIVDDMN